MLPGMGPVAFLLRCLLLLFAAESRARARPGALCQFQGRRFSPGHSWHPSLRPQGTDPCVRCRCAQNAHVSCYRIQCPALPCPHPVTDPQQCCPRCLAVPSEVPPAEDWLQVPRGALRQRRSQEQCSGEAPGRKPAGASPSAVLPSALELIPRSFRAEGGGGTTVQIVLTERQEKACVYQGQSYSHGAVWHPALRPHGLLPCVLCTCRDGLQHCRRLSCPGAYPCAHPQALPGKCCKVCPAASAKPPEVAAPPRCAHSPPRRALPVPPSSVPPREVLRSMAEQREPAGELEIHSWHLTQGLWGSLRARSQEPGGTRGAEEDSQDL
ncbi:chordin-like protein 2 [Dryobates pubescens]|uniref:chordin-like protein 2 n=1 Tax=Dryobates pubescens TaxID=118200 RepID=UPI0023B88ED9|nr:chordin-like protein 2 [Dryobates pubescens]